MTQEEAKDFLSGLIVKMNEQDNRATATPYFYVIKDELGERNVFFTERACLENIENNRHHYVKPYSYVKHAFRNPELQKLFDAIGVLVGVKYEHQ